MHLLNFVGCLLLDQKEQHFQFVQRQVNIYLKQKVIIKYKTFVGVIEPYQTIDSEVVWYGSTQAPLENYFTLHIFSTNESRKATANNNSLIPNSETTLTLHCIAQVGKAKFKIPEKRVNFGSIPINMTSKKSFTIVNEGTNHLFYQVLFKYFYFMM